MTKQYLTFVLSNTKEFVKISVIDLMLDDTTIKSSKKNTKLMN